MVDPSDWWLHVATPVLLVCVLPKTINQSIRTCQQKNATKRLAAIVKLAFDIIPQDPTLPDYRQGKTLGIEYKHWFRAKFFQQYRLFFRYHLEEKIIVFAWVNDNKTKRAYNSKRDAYKVFEKMLNNGNPPHSWDDLMKQSKTESERLQKLIRND